MGPRVGCCQGNWGVGNSYPRTDRHIPSIIAHRCYHGFNELCHEICTFSRGVILRFFSLLYAFSLILFFLTPIVRVGIILEELLNFKKPFVLHEGSCTHQRFLLVLINNHFSVFWKNANSPFREYRDFWVAQTKCVKKI